MEWEEALESVIANGGPEKYREYCAESHPRHEDWRAKMIAKAGGEPPVRYPPIARQAANLAGAVGRVVSAVVNGEPVRVAAEVLERRRAICLTCEFHDRERGRCTKCGCGGAKLELATEQCPLTPPRWERESRS